MKRFMLCLLLFPMAVMAQVPSYPVRLDLQSPSRTFALKWAAGSSPILSAYVSDGGRAYTNLSGWTGYVYVAVTPTAGVYVAASPVASNRVDFSFTAAQTATVGTFGVEVVLGNGTNTYRWGTGSLSLSNSPALLGAGTVPLTGVFNWDLFTFTGTQPPLSASYTNPLAGDVTGVPGATVIGDGVVGTNNLDAEVRGMLETTGIDTNSAAWTGLVASVSTAASTGTAAHAVAVIASNKAAQAVGWGNHATNGYLHLVNGFTNSYLLEDSPSDSLIFKPGNTLFTWRNEEWGNNVTGFPKSTLSNGDRIYVLTQSGGFTAVTLSGGNWDTSLDMSAYGWSTSLYPVVFFYRDSSSATTVTVNKVSDPAQSIVGYYDDLTIRYTLFDLKRDVLSLQQSAASYNLALGTNAPAAWTNQPSLLALSNAIVTAGASSTNFGLAIGAGATALVAQASAAGTNFTLATAAGNSNLTLAAYALASNSFTYASNVLDTANAIGPTWSQTLTNTLYANTNGINNAKWLNVHSGHNGEAPANSFIRTTSHLFWKANDGTTNYVAHSGNLSIVGVQTVAGANATLTNTLWRWSGFIQGGTGQRGNMYESNGWLYVWSDASNAYGRVQLGF